MKAGVLDLQFLNSLKASVKRLNSLAISLQGLENAVSEAKAEAGATASASFNKKIDTVFKNYCKKLDEKAEEFEEAIYTAKICKQRLDSMIPYWSDRLLEQDGKLLDYDDKFSAVNKRIVSQDNNYQEQTKLIDTILEIVEGDINKEAVIDERLKKLEFDIARIYELMDKQVIELNPLPTKSSMISIPLENFEKTFIENKPIVVTETLQTLDSALFEKPKPIAKPGVKGVSEGKENNPDLSSTKTLMTSTKTPVIPSVDKKPITSEYSKYFSDKMVQKVEVNLFDVGVEKAVVEKKTEPKKPIKHVKTKSVDVDQFKKK